MLRARTGSLIAAAAIVFAACGGSATPSPSAAPSQQASPSAAAASAAASPSAAASAAAGAPVDGGTLVVGLDGDMVYADPSLVSDGNSLYVANQVVEGLVGLAPGTLSEIVPVLASDLPTISPDGLTYTFKLRSDV